MLFDRRMEGFSGGIVVMRLREAGHDMPVAMVTPVDPDFDILEMGSDDYVVKPVRPDEIRDLVEILVRRRDYDDLIWEYFAPVSKVTALQRAKNPGTLYSSEEYVWSELRLEEIKRQARIALDAAIEAGEFHELLREFATVGREVGASSESDSEAAASD